MVLLWVLALVSGTWCTLFMRTTHRNYVSYVNVLALASTVSHFKYLYKSDFNGQFSLHSSYFPTFLQTLFLT